MLVGYDMIKHASLAIYHIQCALVENLLIIIYFHRSVKNKTLYYFNNFNTSFFFNFAAHCARRQSAGNFKWPTFKRVNPKCKYTSTYYWHWCHWGTGTCTTTTNSCKSRAVIIHTMHTYATNITIHDSQLFIIHTHCTPTTGITIANE